MTIKKTTWKPETCKCVVEFTWDTEVHAVARIHSWFDTIVHCPAHTENRGPAHLDALFDECGRLNIAIGLMQDILIDVVPGQVAWSFDTRRLLTVSLIGPLGLAEQREIQYSCDLQFGPDKVLVAGAR